MRPIFPLDEKGTMKKFIHFDCAHDANLHVDDLEYAQCHYCGGQFFCEKEPTEACMLVSVGVVENEKFKVLKRGAVHWVHASTHWKPEIFGGVNGYDDEDEGSSE